MTPLSEEEALKLWEQYKDSVYEGTKDANHLNKLSNKTFKSIKDEVFLSMMTCACFIPIFFVVLAGVFYWAYNDNKKITAELLTALNNVAEGSSKYIEIKGELEMYGFPLGLLILFIIVYAAVTIGLGAGVILKNQEYVNKTTNSFDEHHIEYIWEHFNHVIVNKPYDYREKYTKIDDITIKLF
jgi:hypothetical protein